MQEGGTDFCVWSERPLPNGKARAKTKNMLPSQRSRFFQSYFKSLYRFDFFKASAELCPAPRQRTGVLWNPFLLKEAIGAIFRNFRIPKDASPLAGAGQSPAKAFIPKQLLFLP